MKAKPKTRTFRVMGFREAVGFEVKDVGTTLPGGRDCVSPTPRFGEGVGGTGLGGRRPKTSPAYHPLRSGEGGKARQPSSFLPRALRVQGAGLEDRVPVGARGRVDDPVLGRVVGRLVPGALAELLSRVRPGVLIDLVDL